jgi:hypothetical protein
MFIFAVEAELAASERANVSASVDADASPGLGLRRRLIRLIWVPTFGGCIRASLICSRALRSRTCTGALLAGRGAARDSSWRSTGGTPAVTRYYSSQRWSIATHSARPSRLTKRHRQRRADFKLSPSATRTARRFVSSARYVRVSSTPPSVRLSPLDGARIHWVEAAQAEQLIRFRGTFELCHRTISTDRSGKTVGIRGPDIPSGNASASKEARPACLTSRLAKASGRRPPSDKGKMWRADSAPVAAASRRAVSMKTR